MSSDATNTSSNKPAFKNEGDNKSSTNSSASSKGSSILSSQSLGIFGNHPVSMDHFLKSIGDIGNWAFTEIERARNASKKRDDFLHNQILQLQ
jgi:hypothetical protein